MRKRVSEGWEQDIHHPLVHIQIPHGPRWQVCLTILDECLSSGLLHYCGLFHSQLCGRGDLIPEERPYSVGVVYNRRDRSAPTCYLCLRKSQGDFRFSYLQRKLLDFQLFSTIETGWHIQNSKPVGRKEVPEDTSSTSKHLAEGAALNPQGVSRDTHHAASNMV